MIYDGVAEETRTRVNENGRVVIPSSFRKALGIRVGDEVVLRIEGDELRITTQQRRIQRAQGRARQYLKPGTSLVDELLAERREAAKQNGIMLHASTILAIIGGEPRAEELTHGLLAHAPACALSLATAD